MLACSIVGYYNLQFCILILPAVQDDDLTSDIKFMGNLIYSDVDGAGASTLVGDEDSGMGISARMQYLF